MSNWKERVSELKAKHKDNPWSPYAPQSKQGFELLAVHENLACVLCESLVKAIIFTEEGQIVVNTDGSIVIGCDYDMTGGYRKVALIPHVDAKGGATIGASSEHGCRRGLLGE